MPTVAVTIQASAGGRRAGDVERYTLDTRTLIGAGSMRRDRKDLRVLYLGAEIDRILLDSSTIAFRIQANIPAGIADSSSYSVRYGEGDTGDPKANQANVWPRYVDGSALASMTLTGTVAAETVPAPRFIKGPSASLARTPNSADELNVRDVDGMLYENGWFYVWYDADDGGRIDGIVAWTVHYARSRDLVTWEKLGQVLTPGGGPPASSYDSAAATSLMPHKFTIGGVTRFYATYLGCEEVYDGIPVAPYICHGATSDSVDGPWAKQGVLVPLGEEGAFDEATTADAEIQTFDGGTTYEMVYGSGTFAAERSVGRASASHPMGPWTKLGQILPLAEQIENPRIVYDSASGRYYLLANHVGLKDGFDEHTVSNVVYWSTDRTSWSAEQKSSITEPEAGKWDAFTIGLPSRPVIIDGVIYMAYDGGDYTAFTTSTGGHKKRDAGFVEALWPFPDAQAIRLTGATASARQSWMLVGDGKVTVRAKVRSASVTSGVGLRSTGSETYYVIGASDDRASVSVNGSTSASIYRRFLGQTKTLEFERAGSTLTIRVSGLQVWAGAVTTQPLDLYAFGNVTVEEAWTTSAALPAPDVTFPAPGTVRLTGTRPAGSTITVEER